MVSPVTQPTSRHHAPSRLVELRISPHRAVPLLAIAMLLLCAASFGLEVLRHGLHVEFRGMASLLGYFNVDGESNVPTWFQSGLLLMCAASFWTTADDALIDADPWARHWRLLAVVFGYLSVDELASLHERADEPLHQLFNTSGALLWAWVLLAVPLLVIFGLAYLSFLRAQPRSVTVGLLLAAAVYVGGAIAVEMLGSYLFAVGGPDSLPYQAAATAEEALEMTGLLVLLTVLGRRERSAAERPQVVLRASTQGGVDLQDVRSGDA